MFCVDRIFAQVFRGRDRIRRSPHMSCVSARSGKPGRPPNGGRRTCNEGRDQTGSRPKNEHCTYFGRSAGRDDEVDRKIFPRANGAATRSLCPPGRIVRALERAREPDLAQGHGAPVRATCAAFAGDRGGVSFSAGCARDRCGHRRRFSADPAGDLFSGKRFSWDRRDREEDQCGERHDRKPWSQQLHR